MAWDPSQQLIDSIRLYQRFQDRSGVLNNLLRKASVLNYRFWSAVVAADIPLNTYLGEGLLMPHANGCVFHPNIKMGKNCLVMQQVTIGIGSTDDVPVIGDNCQIGAGAKILGGITIGNDVVIGANAVVIRDVPSGHIAVGIPATSKLRKDYIGDA